MIAGSIVALVTPMLDDGAIDWASMDALLEMHIQEGTGAIVSVGTTGESATLSVKEHCAVIAYMVKKVNGAIPLVAGTGANSTAEAIELTAAARGDGADACLLVTPYYNKPNQEGLYRHFSEVAELGLPVWSEPELAVRLRPDRTVVGVTGTNGKTSVTELTTAMLIAGGVAAFIFLGPPSEGPDEGNLGFVELM